MHSITTLIFAVISIMSVIRDCHHDTCDQTSGIWFFFSFQKQLDELRNTYQSIVTVQKGRKKSVLPWKKKEKQPELNIQVCVYKVKYTDGIILIIIEYNAQFKTHS